MSMNILEQLSLVPITGKGLIRLFFSIEADKLSDFPTEKLQFYWAMPFLQAVQSQKLLVRTYSLEN